MARVEEADLFAGVAELQSAPFAPAVGGSGDLGRSTSMAGALTEIEAMTRLVERCGTRAPDALRIAERLLTRFGGLGRVLGAPPADLAREVGETVAWELGVLHALLLSVLAYPLRRRPMIGSWDAAKTYVRAQLAALPREAFHVLFLDAKNQLIADERLAKGSTNHAPVYPREVIRRALELSASAVLLVHNHPTGDVTPSKSDVESTRQVVAAGKPLGIAVHDHFIVGGGEVASLKALGLM